MQNDLATVRGVVNSLLRQHVDEAARQAGVIDDGLVDFWQRIGTVMQAGGKRLRPYLLVLAYEACGGNDRWTVMPVAVAWEALHQALLIHDDIIDNDNWRHGQPNVAGMYEHEYQQRTGKPQLAAAESTALLAGDLLFAAATQFVLASEVPMVMKPDLLKLLNFAYQATCYGELLEVEALFQPPLTAKALQIAELKTAYYSLSGPLQSGAVLAGAPEDVIDQLAELGQVTGVAYQLTDDLLGVFGDEIITGKSASSDLQERKRTRLLQLTYLQLNPSDQELLTELLEQPLLSDTDLQSIRTLMLSSGAVETLQHEIGQYVARARMIINGLHISPLSRERFNELIDLAVQRQA